ncbi:MAG: hypothetical protein IIW84_06070, partial [Selenomonadaceae bacterium]|nr:hypothetical protein [Selenomonadaceae bacterium]
MKLCLLKPGALSMENKVYSLRYLLIFEQDLTQTINYIANTLQNKEAATKLLNDIEAAILKRLNAPLAFEPFPSSKNASINIFAFMYTVLLFIMW